MITIDDPKKLDKPITNIGGPEKRKKSSEGRSSSAGSDGVGADGVGEGQKKKPVDNPTLSKGPATIIIQDDNSTLSMTSQAEFKKFRAGGSSGGRLDEACMKFPLCALPKDIGELCKGIAAHTESRAEMAATFCLGTLAALEQTKHVIQIDHKYRETMSLFAITVADSGERKSAVFSRVTSPAREAVEEYNQSIEKDVSDSKANLQKMRSRHTFLEKSLATLSPSDPKRAELDREYNELEHKISSYQKKKPLNVFFDDVTVEAAIDRLANNDGAIAIASAESGFFGNLRRYDSANIDAFLKCHSGDAITVSRIGRGEQLVKNARMSLILAAQPIIIKRLFADREFYERGLCGRFLFAFCESTAGTKKGRAKPEPESVSKAWKDGLRRIIFEKDAKEITLSPEAEDAFWDYYQAIDKMTVNGGALSDMKDWASKAHGNMIRIAGLIHCWENEFPSRKPISGDAAMRARAISDYYLRNAISAYSGAYELNANSEKVFNSILKIKKAKPNGEINRRVVMQNSNLDKSAFEAAIFELEENGYISLVERKNVKNRSSLIIFVNPLAERQS